MFQGAGCRCRRLENIIRMLWFLGIDWWIAAVLGNLLWVWLNLMQHRISIIKNLSQIEINQGSIRGYLSVCPSIHYQIFFWPTGFMPRLRPRLVKKSFYIDLGPILIALVILKSTSWKLVFVVFHLMLKNIAIIDNQHQAYHLDSAAYICSFLDFFLRYYNAKCVRLSKCAIVLSVKMECVFFSVFFERKVWSF